MPRFRNLGPGTVRTKTDALDVVTEADTAAEAAITAGLLRRFPGAVVVGEEAAAADPSLLGCLGDADLAFVVDPVDGTANFADGLPLFAVMAAALVRGEVVAACIHDPLGDDWALALRGEGAWRETPDGRREALRVAAPAPVGGDDRQRVVALPAAGAARDGVRQPAARRGGLGVSLRGTRVPAWSRPGACTSCCSTGCIRGITRRAGCCTRRPAGMRRRSTAARIGRHGSMGD